jgi:hypothetical protein
MTLEVCLASRASSANAHRKPLCEPITPEIGTEDPVFGSLALATGKLF